MADLIDVIRYLCANYPNQSDLSNARLTKMVYLADWRAAIYHGRPITAVSWVFNHYGPYVEDVVDEARKHSDEFQIIETRNIYGNRKTLVRYIGKPNWPSLGEDEESVLDHVIDTTSKKSWDAFLNLVYATYPVTTQARYSPLDLEELAARYREVRNDLGWGIPESPS